MGDVDKEKAIFAEVFKLLGNSCYGKMTEALEGTPMSAKQRTKKRRPCATLSLV